MQVFDKSGKELYAYAKTIDVPLNGLVDCFTLVVPEKVELPPVYFLKLQLFSSNNSVLADNFYWESKARNKRFYEFNQYEKVTLNADGNVKISDGVFQGIVGITNPSKTVALAIKLGLQNAKTQERVLPAYFHYGYFALMPNETRLVTFEIAAERTPDEFLVTAEGYNVDRHTLVVMKKIDAVASQDN